MDKKFIVYLHYCGFSHRELSKMQEIWKNFWDIFNTLTEKTIWYYVWNEKRKKQIFQRHKEINIWYIDAEISRLWVAIILYTDAKYPEKLKHISNPPFILYVRGQIPQKDMFWVVWSRKMTTYGKKIIDFILPELGEIFPIVSGGAIWCDTQAHKTCIQNNQKTVVVMGTGINVCYPQVNKKMFETIVEQEGVLISSFRIDEPGNHYNFPVRNEIIVGLSQGILVVEAEKKSWSLITAGLALDAGKDLFAVPWDIFVSCSTGTNMLIQKGEAKAVFSGQDILEEYLISIVKSQKGTLIELLSSEEKDLYNHLSQRSMSFDQILLSFWIEPSKLLSLISLLEIKSYIKKDLEWKYYIA